MTRSTLKYAVTAALLAGTVAATPAVAKPVDSDAPASPAQRIDRFGAPTSSLAGTTEKQKQDLRSADAIDSGLQPEYMPNQPTWPAYPAPATKPTTPVALTGDTDGGGDGIWLVLGLGIAGAGVAAGAAGAARRTRRVPA
jgi:hypothetical protein